MTSTNDRSDTRHHKPNDKQPRLRQSKPDERSKYEQRSYLDGHYPVDQVLIMTLSGEWSTGGYLEFELEDQHLDLISLPPSQWAIVANLFLASINSQSTNWVNGFVTTKRLVESLDDHDLASFPTAQTIYRIVNNIRSKLSELETREHTQNVRLSGQQWAEIVLQNQGRIGYRIGLHPTRLRLNIGEQKTWGSARPKDNWDPDGS